MEKDSCESYTFVVIGGGIAGVSCVEQILEYDAEASILLISLSEVVKEATNVTRLTKTLQDFVLVEKSLKSFKDVHQSVTVINDYVTSIKGADNTLFTSGGKSFRYKKCCICSGARPNNLFPDSKHVVVVRDTESVKDLSTRLKNARKVLVLGNGGIATEFVHEVDDVEICWAIKDTSISAHFVDSGAAEFFVEARNLRGGNEETNPPSEKKSKLDEEQSYNVLKSNSGVTKYRQYTIQSVGNTGNKWGTGSALGPDWHRNYQLRGHSEKKNVTVLYETECLEVYDGENAADDDSISEVTWPVYAKLSNGETLGVDVVISATGVIPNCDWLGDEFEKDLEKGIFVNSEMLTSVQNVYAAGDVCYPRWDWSKHWFQMKLWTQARHMGLYVGKSMYLSSKEIENEEETEPIDLDFCFELFSHVTRFFGFKVVLLGLFNGQGLDKAKQHLLVRCTKNYEYIKLVLEDWRLQGAVLIGETGLEETFENLILNQVDLSTYGEDLLNPDIDIEDYFD